MYSVRYIYTNPSSAGPFKGRMTVQVKYRKGDIINAPFGEAQVTSCSPIQP